MHTSHTIVSYNNVSTVWAREIFKLEFVLKQSQVDNDSICVGIQLRTTLIGGRSSGMGFEFLS